MTDLENANSQFSQYIAKFLGEPNLEIRKIYKGEIDFWRRAVKF